MLDSIITWDTKLAQAIERWRARLPLLPKPKATIDFETRSACDLTKHGSWLYSKHPTTEAMVLRYKLPGQDEVGIWHMAHPEHGIEEAPPPEDLFAFILAGGLVEAHNSFFERVIWRNVMVARHGWPEVSRLQWRCSAAKASAASLPRDLGGACVAMGLSVVKDMAGRKNMLKLSRPRKPRKAEVEAWKREHALEDRVPPMPLLWHEDEEDIRTNWEYCAQDVRAEEALSEATPELNEKELMLWQLDQDMNERGVRFDLELAHAALRVATGWKKRLNAELHRITGTVEKGSQRKVVKEWLLENEGLDLPDTKATTLEFYLDRREAGLIELSDRCVRILHIVKQVNRTSTRKYQAMIDRTDPDDGRARDLLMYHGAGTGRWTGKGIQVHNLPRGFSKTMDSVVEDIKTEDLDWLYFLHGDVMELLSHAIRGAIISSEGKDFMAADYSAIEARCVLWEAGAQAALDVFRKGGDIYCDMATGIYGYEVINTPQFAKERQFGKQAILGLGYGMGFITFLLTCRKYKIYFTVEQVEGILKDRFDKYVQWVEDYLFPKPSGDPKKDKNRRRQAAQVRRRLTDEREDPRAILHELALMKFTVDVYRTRYPEVKQLWKDQEMAAIAAVREWEALVLKAQEDARFDWELEGNEVGFDALPWETVEFLSSIDGPVKDAGITKWFVRRGWLCCQLPSGRLLRYRVPHIKPTKTSWGEVREGLRYMSVTNQQWVRTSTYGGKLVENITQAIARDALADAMLVMGDTIYILAFHVHDELIAEVDEDEGSHEEFEELMSAIDPWAEGCPIVAEAKRFKRYRK